MGVSILKNMAILTALSVTIIFLQAMEQKAESFPKDEKFIEKSNDKDIIKLFLKPLMEYFDLLSLEKTHTILDAIIQLKKIYGAGFNFDQLKKNNGPNDYEAKDSSFMVSESGTRINGFEIPHEKIVQFNTSFLQAKRRALYKHRDLITKKIDYVVLTIPRIITTDNLAQMKKLIDILPAIASKRVKERIQYSSSRLTPRQTDIKDELDLYKLHGKFLVVNVDKQKFILEIDNGHYSKKRWPIPDGGDWYRLKKNKIAAVQGKTVSIWNYETGECVSNLIDDGDEIKILIPLSKKRLATGSTVIKIWDRKKKHCLITFTNDASENIENLIELSDNRLASYSTAQEYPFRGFIKIWDISTGECLQTKILKSSEKPYFFMHNDFLTVQATRDLTLRGYDSKTMKQYGFESLYARKPIVKDNNNFFYCCGEGFYKANFSGDKQCFMRHTKKVTALAVLSDTHIASGSDDKSVIIWNHETKECLRVIKFPSKIKSLFYSNNTLLVDASNDDRHAINILPIPTYEEALEFQAISNDKKNSIEKFGDILIRSWNNYWLG